MAGFSAKYLMEDGKWKKKWFNNSSKEFNGR